MKNEINHYNMNMKLRNIPFSPPDMSEAEINEVADALRSGWITTGPKTKEFERQIAEYVGTQKGTGGRVPVSRIIGVSNNQ